MCQHTHIPVPLRMTDDYLDILQMFHNNTNHDTTLFMFKIRSIVYLFIWNHLKTNYFSKLDKKMRILTLGYNLLGLGSDCYLVKVRRPLSSWIKDLTVTGKRENKQRYPLAKVLCFVDPSIHPDVLLCGSIVKSPHFFAPIGQNHNYYGCWRALSLEPKESH